MKSIYDRCVELVGKPDDSGMYDAELVYALGGFYPLGVLPNDAQQTIRTKVGVSPTNAFSRAMPESAIWREEYDLQNVDLDLHFDREGGNLLFWLVSRKKAKS